MPRRLWLAGLIALALCLRLAALAVIQSTPLTNSESGWTAANWVAGRGYTMDFYGYRATSPLQSFMPPLLTAIIAACLRTPWPRAVFGAVQVALSTLGVVLVLVGAERLAGRAVGLLAALFVAVYPPFLVLNALDTATVLNGCLLALWIWAVLRLAGGGGWRWAVLAGVALGLSFLSRPSTLGLLGVTGAALWVWPGRATGWSRYWRQVLGAAAVAGLVVAPWLAREVWVHGRLVWISTNGGFNFWNGNNPFTTGSCWDVRLADLAAYAGDRPSAPPGAEIVEVRPYPLPLELRASVGTLDELALDRALYRASFDFIREHPGDWLRLLAQKLASLWWFRPNIGRSSGFYQEAWILPYEILYSGMLIAAVGGIVVSLRNWRRYVALYGLFAWLTIVYVGYHAITRYRWEFEAWLLVFAALFVVHVWRRRSWKLVRAVLGVVLSLACLWLAFRGVRPAEVIDLLGRARLLPLLGAVAVEFLTFWAIAARWQLLFEPPAVPGRGRLFRVLNIAQLANAVLPAKPGSVVRAVMAGEGRPDGIARVLATIVGEKVVEGLSLFLVAVGLLPFVPLAGWLRLTAAIGAGLLLASMAFMVWLACRPEAAGRGLDRLLGRWPRVRGLAQAVLSGFRPWRDRRTVLALWLWSLAIWGLTAVLNRLLLWSLGIQVPAAAPFAILVLSQIGIRLPSSPSSVGVLHYMSVVALSAFGVAQGPALGFALLLHLVTYLPPSLLGLLFLARSGFRLGQLRRLPDTGSVP